MEAERAGDAYEAEYGADGYRMFPGNAPEADSEETAMPTLQEEKVAGSALPSSSLRKPRSSYS